MRIRTFAYSIVTRLAHHGDRIPESSWLILGTRGSTLVDISKLFSPYASGFDLIALQYSIPNLTDLRHGLVVKNILFFESKRSRPPRSGINIQYITRPVLHISLIDDHIMLVTMHTGKSINIRNIHTLGQGTYLLQIEITEPITGGQVCRFVQEESFCLSAVVGYGVCVGGA